jgi:hypothetical protein
MSQQLSGLRLAISLLPNRAFERMRSIFHPPGELRLALGVTNYLKSTVRAVSAYESVLQLVIRRERQADRHSPYPRSFAPELSAVIWSK